METITVGHISDLHFSDGASHSSPHRHSIPHLKLIQSVLDGRNLDRLIVSGDLTDRGDKESLLRVRDWLFSDYSISGTERIGLNFPEELVRIVPGNHDAYNAERSSGSYLDCWQKSVANFMEVFPNDRILNGCDYEWLEKGEFGFFIAYVDSCFLGDPSLRHLKAFKKALITSISKVARGKISLRQSNQLVKWFDLGMTGNLKNVGDDDSQIPKDKFAKSFKLLVMHHYLFEPPGFQDDFFLNFHHRDTVFQNVAMADFDMYLCGHKHVSDFGTHYYGDHFDRRSIGRYILNLFRRRLGANTLPFQFKDANGKHISNHINRLIEVIALKVKSEGTDEESFIDALMSVLRSGIENPTQFGTKLEQFVREYKISGKEIIEDGDVQEIQTRISSQLTKREREILAATGLTYITRIAKGIRHRPFVQSMCGSSAKASLSNDTARSFNIYVFELDSNICKVRRTRFKLNPAGNTDESVNEFSFSNCNHVMLKGH